MDQELQTADWPTLLTVHALQPVRIYSYTWRTILHIVTTILWLQLETTEPIGFCEEDRPNSKNNKKMSRDMGSVPDPKVNVKAT